MEKPRLNFHCNFRAPTNEWFQVWLELKNQTKALGLDICFVVLSLCRVWLESQKEIESINQINASKQIIYITQKNTFNYNVQRPRRDKVQANCSKSGRKCTLCSKAFEAYIIVVARELNREFCFRDFPEIGHDFFRKLILNLRLKGEVMGMKPRALPQFYVLPEWKDRYPSMNEKTENNRVTPKFTDKGFTANFKEVEGAA